MYNPDYPTPDASGFLQYTYRPQQNIYNYWDGGMAMNMGATPSYFNSYPNADSRRNTMNPVNPFNAFGNTQPGMPNTQMPTNGAFPTTVPMGNAAAGGLNAMINDSRRNAPQNETSNNPWAPQQPQNNQMNVPTNPYANNPMAYGPYGFSGTSCFNQPSPLVNCGMSLPTNFTTKNAWDNYYTQSRALPMPVIDWRQQPQQMQNPYQQPQQMQPQYPLQQIPTVQQNWKDIAERNWKNSNI